MIRDRAEEQSGILAGNVTSTDTAAVIVAAYVSNNSVPLGELPALIQSVHAALEGLGKPTEPEPVRLVPPVPIKKTITPDAIISLEDGKPYKSLKRHLSGRGLTPEQYREKWGLPPDYPMVAASYAAQRSEIAKGFGLGGNSR
ncbi:MucR family transcriptional regulator, partial [Methylobacterium sp. WSM2598]|uniref:MucR family transcriptional regulator n=1 Tax=Methylobacterium sp. WSM2598 TaxID=398261 RepID=UPI00037BC7A3